MRASPGFVFDPERHEPGARNLLGASYPQEGIAQGEAVLRDIAAHPATATHVATKLARHFIADEPPPEAVARIARAFRDSDGHLPTVYAALLDCREAWTQPLAKLKSPIEYVVSCLRALPGLACGRSTCALRHSSRHGAATLLRAVAPRLAGHRRGLGRRGRALEAHRVGGHRGGAYRLPRGSVAPRDRELWSRRWGRRRGAPSSAPKVASKAWRSGSPARNFSGGRHENASTSAAAASVAPPRSLDCRGSRSAQRRESSEASDRRLVFMFLRGGMDGLSAVPPHRRLRSTPCSAARLPCPRRLRPAGRSISTATSD